MARKSIKLRDGLRMRLPDDSDQWIASYRKLDGSRSQWRAPRDIGPKEDLRAERHFLAKYADYNMSGVSPLQSEVHADTRVTLTDLADRWLTYREQDEDTDPDYARSLKSQWANHIEGTDIATVHIPDLDDLDIESWLKGVQRAPSTRLTVASTLSVFLDDAIVHRRPWGLPKMLHPMRGSPRIRRYLAKLRDKMEVERVKPNLTAEQSGTLLCHDGSKIRDYRKVKYLVRLFSGIREREAEGLVFTDFRHLPMQHVFIQRQLVSGERCAAPLDRAYALAHPPNLGAQRHGHRGGPQLARPASSSGSPAPPGRASMSRPRAALHPAHRKPSTIGGLRPVEVHGVVGGSAAPA